MKRNLYAALGATITLLVLIGAIGAVINFPELFIVVATMVLGVLAWMVLFTLFLTFP